MADATTVGVEFNEETHNYRVIHRGREAFIPGDDFIGLSPDELSHVITKAAMRLIEEADAEDMAKTEEAIPED